MANAFAHVMNSVSSRGLPCYCIRVRKETWYCLGAGTEHLKLLSSCIMKIKAQEESYRHNDWSEKDGYSDL